jgi:hypothetical protein
MSTVYDSALPLEELDARLALENNLATVTFYL